MRKYLVRDWMTPDPISISPKATLPEAQRIMRDSKIRRLLVVDKGKVVGIVTKGDVREAGPSDATSLSVFELNYLLAQLTIDKVMTRNPVTITSDATIFDAAQLMLEHKIGGLPVVDQGQLVGILTESDIFREMVQQEAQEAQESNAAEMV